VKIRYLFVALMATYAALAKAQDVCPPLREFYQLPDDYPGGKYSRISPDGRFILQTTDSAEGPRTFLLQLPQIPSDSTEVKILPLPLNDEAYPVEPTWNWIASPNHEQRTTMQYFRMEKLLRDGMKATPDFADSTHNQFYHSAAEYAPGKIRVLLYENRRVRDYKVEESFSLSRLGTKTYKFSPLKSGTLCHNLIPEDKANRIKVVREKYFDLMWTIQKFTNELQKQWFQMTLEKLYEDLVELTGIGDFHEPILSKTGQEVAAFTVSEGRGSLKLFSIKDDFSCELKEDLGYMTSKANFSYSGDRIVFTGGVAFGNFAGSGVELRPGVHIYNRQTKETFKVSDPLDSQLISYPGFTQDGRVIYGSCRKIAGQEVCGINVVQAERLDPRTGGEKPNTCSPQLDRLNSTETN
jgi:hypothetical protein